MNNRLNILYEDREMLVCSKPAGIAVQSRSIGKADLESMVRMHLMKENGRRDNFVAAVHRLDQPVEGMVVFAKTRQSAAVFARQIQQQEWKKDYLAITEGIWEPEAGCLENYLKKDGKTNTSRVVEETDKDAKRAVLEYQVLQTRQGRQLVCVHLLTGRHHQIRVQLSHAGHPIVGDMRYNKMEVNQKAGQAVALAAFRLEMKHPLTSKPLIFLREPQGAGFADFDLPEE